MIFKNILLFIFINLIIIACVKKHKSPLNIDVNEVESMEITYAIGYFENDSLIRKDTIIPIPEKHWISFIGNFNQAVSPHLFKSA